MSTLQQTLEQIQNAQNAGTTLADAGAVVTALQAQLFEQLVAAVTALQGATSATPDASAAATPTTEQLQALIQPLVSEAITTAFGRLENAASEAQPAVAQNTGSGAAPVAPSATAASDSASSTPGAAGTAPTTSA